MRCTSNFDGTSACELLNVLKESPRTFLKISIDTRGLRHIYPFGVDTFQKNLYRLKDRPFRLEFIGENATRLAPERSRHFHSSVAEAS